jgi:DNA-binding NarL/FixJ family response regulator
MYSSETPAAACRPSGRRAITLCGPSLLLDTLAVRIDHEPDLYCAGVIGDAEPLTNGTPASAADVVVFEARTPEALRQIEQRFPQATLVLVRPDEIDPAADPSGVLASWPRQVTSSDSLTRFLTVLREAAGQAAAAVNGADGPVSPAEQLQGLNRRELDVFQLLAKGNSVKEVARTLGISFKAVDSQKYRIMRKLGLTDRVQVTRLAIRAGLITP